MRLFFTSRRMALARCLNDPQKTLCVLSHCHIVEEHVGRFVSHPTFELLQAPDPL